VLEATLTPEEADIAKRKRLIYRSKQRGWLEVDLLMGSWAAENVPKLTAAELDEYHILLEEETIDIFNYVSGKDVLPPHLENLSIIPVIKKYAYSSRINSPLRYAEIKEKANLT
jgi:succinate dehydrogenase assembly factor 2